MKQIWADQALYEFSIRADFERGSTRSPRHAPMVHGPCASLQVTVIGRPLLLRTQRCSSLEYDVETLDSGS